MVRDPDPLAARPVLVLAVPLRLDAERARRRRAGLAAGLRIPDAQTLGRGLLGQPAVGAVPGPLLAVREPEREPAAQQLLGGVDPLAAALDLDRAPQADARVADRAAARPLGDEPDGGVMDQVLEELGGLDPQACALAALAAVVEELRRLDARQADALLRAELVPLEDPRLDGVAVVGRDGTSPSRRGTRTRRAEHAGDALRARRRGEHERRENSRQDCKQPNSHLHPQSGGSWQRRSSDAFFWPFVRVEAPARGSSAGTVRRRAAARATPAPGWAGSLRPPPHAASRRPAAGACAPRSRATRDRCRARAALRGLRS